jgi:HSP90 family molecular chaperone
VVYVPKTAPFDFYDKYYEKGAKGALKLFVRRVFITGEVGERGQGLANVHRGQ